MKIYEVIYETKSDKIKKGLLMSDAQFEIFKRKSDIKVISHKCINCDDEPTYSSDLSSKEKLDKPVTINATKKTLINLVSGIGYIPLDEIWKYKELKLGKMRFSGKGDPQEWSWDREALSNLACNELAELYNKISKFGKQKDEIFLYEE